MTAEKKEKQIITYRQLVRVLRTLDFRNTFSTASFDCPMKKIVRENFFWLSKWQANRCWFNLLWNDRQAQNQWVWFDVWRRTRCFPVSSHDEQIRCCACMPTLRPTSSLSFVIPLPIDEIWRQCSRTTRHRCNAEFDSKQSNNWNEKNLCKNVTNLSRLRSINQIESHFLLYCSPVEKGKKSDYRWTIWLIDGQTDLHLCCTLDHACTCYAKNQLRTSKKEKSICFVAFYCTCLT